MNDRLRTLLTLPLLLVACACSRPQPPAGGPAKLQPQAPPAIAPPESATVTTTATAPEAGAAVAEGALRAIGPVATVNGRDIPADKFNSELSKYVGPQVRIPTDRLQRIARSITQRLVEAELREQAIAEHRIALSEPEMEDAWREFSQRFADDSGKVDEARLQDELKRSRRSLAELKEQIRQQRLGKKLVERLGRVEVGEVEMRAFYEGNPSSFVEPASRDLRTIVVRVGSDAPPSERDKAEQRAKAAYDALKQGQDFELVAKQHGDGLQPPLHLTRNATEPELEKVAFDMKVGDIAPPVRTRWGWYVVRLLEKSEQRTRTFVEVREEIRRTILARKSFLEERRILQDLRRKADVIEKLPF
jgi:hypothetical protein